MEMTLNLPREYVEIEEEEMMYLDGGVKTYYNWWGTSTKISKSECQQFMRYSGAIGLAGAIAIMGLSGMYGVFMAVGFAVIDIGSKGRGVWINKAHSWAWPLVGPAPVWASF